MPVLPALPEILHTSTTVVDQTDWQAFTSKVYQGAGIYLPEVTDEVLDRLLEELTAIQQLDIYPYFLFWEDLLDFCKDENICTGPGRGIISCSLVARCLGMTAINPLDWQLPFQRFFNPLSSLLPAFSVDVPQNKRESLINFLKAKYGKAHVGALAGRNEDEGGVSNINKIISPAGSGVVISSQALLPTVPTMKLRDESDDIIVDFPSKHLQNLGCIKFDIYGLRHLETLQNIRDKYKTDIYPDRWDDPEVFSWILSVKSKETFPFNTETIRQFMKEYQPETMEDLALSYAISRPALQSYIPGMLRIRKQDDDAYFPHESLYKPLQSTYGYIVYKEQFIDIVVSMSNFSYNEAEMMCRLLLEDENSDNYTGRFIDQCEENGIDMSVIQQVMTELIASHPFLFSKAHALGAVMIGYALAWHHVHNRV